MRGKSYPERARPRISVRWHGSTMALFHSMIDPAGHARKHAMSATTSWYARAAHAGRLPDHVWWLTSAEALAHSARSAVMNESLSAAAPCAGERFTKEHGRLCQAMNCLPDTFRQLLLEGHARWRPVCPACPCSSWDSSWAG